MNNEEQREISPITYKRFLFGSLWNLLFDLPFPCVQELRERISTSDSVSDDVQDAFGRQLLVLQTQRDSLLQQLEQQKKDRSSFVDVLEEKNALEDSLR